VEERPHVVVVSADEGVRAQLRLTLGEDRFDVVEVPDVRSAATAVADRVPALVVLDGDLPDGTADGFATSLRAQPETADIRTLLLAPRSASGDDPGQAVDASIAMPATSFALLRRIEGLLAPASHGDPA
jgi:DNA-binding response OmpR family regulator